MKYLLARTRDVMVLALAAGLLAELKDPSPLPGLVVLTLLLAGILYVVLTWLEAHLEQGRQARPGAAKKVRPVADVVPSLKGNGIVLLRDQVWEGSRLDGYSAGWPAAMRGYYQVWSGRHQVVGGGPSGAALDFVLYPDEIYIRRLHARGATWLPEHPENEEEFRKLAQGGPFGSWRDTLVDYQEFARAWPAERREPVLVQPLLDSILRLATRVEAGESHALLMEEAAALGAALIGVPLPGPAMHTITRTVMARATRLAGTHAYDQSLKLLDLGLAILPDDPFLLEVKSTLLVEVGLPEEALGAIEGALCRDQVLRTDGLLRVRATKAQILTRLGRYAEAMALVKTVLKEHPGDARTQLIHTELANRVSD